MRQEYSKVHVRARRRVKRASCCRGVAKWHGLSRRARESCDLRQRLRLRPWHNARMPDPGAVNAAVADFHRARRHADVRAVLSLLGRGDDRLLSYDDVRKRLRAVESPVRTLEDIPLEAIVGSVGRYQDFTREFLPLVDEDRGRWVGVKLAMTGLEGVPPIEVYRLGEAYFVKDGNHRVSVARQLGSKYIQAYVTPVHVRVPFGPDVDQDGLIVASELAQFLEETRLDEVRPQADLRVTVPGQYPILLEHIRVHRYFMGIDLGRPVSWDEAVAHWYDAVYLPVVEAIHEHGLLGRFEGRTETDLYLFLAEHRARLEEELGWSIEGPQLAEGLVPPRTRGIERRSATLTADRAANGAQSVGARLVDAVLLVLQGDAGRRADDEVLHHGLVLAASEEATVYGLHMVTDGGFDDRERATFEAACARAGVRGQLAFSAGDLLREVRERSAFVDLVVVSPGDRSAPDPAVRPLLRRSPKPLLLAGPAPSSGKRPLLAYDGGAKANEALFALAYFALRRGLEPVVLTVGESPRKTEQVSRGATAYLERMGVRATAVRERGAVDEAIARVCREHDCDVVFLGSHRHARWLEEVMGGVLDKVLGRVEVPLLVT